MKSYTVLFLTAAVPFVNESSEFIPIGDLPGGGSYSVALDLSRDGTTLLGESESAAGIQAFRWRRGSGISLLPPFMANKLSADGNVVVGGAYANGMHAAFWSEATGLHTLAALSPAAFPSFSIAFGVSDDASLIAGVAATPLPHALSESIIWAPPGDWALLGFLPEDLPKAPFSSHCYATAVSGDGSVVVGLSASTEHKDRAEQGFRWTATEGLQPLGFLPPVFQSVPTALSADGTVITGSAGFAAFLWTAETGMQNIGEFAPAAMSSDGGVVVGAAPTPFYSVAMIWTREGGAQTLESYLLEKFGVELPGWQRLTEAMGVSGDGLTLAGTGINAAGDYEAFVVKLDPPVQIPVDVDSDNDGFADDVDAVPFSDMRGALFVGETDTGLANRVLADGSTLNDLVAAELANAKNHGDFVSGIANLTKLWSSEGIFPKDAKSLIQKAAAQTGN